MRRRQRRRLLPGQRGLRLRDEHLPTGLQCLSDLCVDPGSAPTASNDATADPPTSEPATGGPTSEPPTDEAFTIEPHGEVTVITASPALEYLDIGLADQAAELMVGPLREQESPQVVVDLARLPFFGSLFLSVLLRCHKLVTTRGGTMVLAGVSEKARELFHITKLDLVWAIYKTRQEAIESLLAE